MAQRLLLLQKADGWLERLPDCPWNVQHRQQSVKKVPDQMTWNKTRPPSR